MEKLFANLDTARPPLLAAAAAVEKRGDGGLGVFLAGIGILVFILAALVIAVSLWKRYRFNMFWGLLAALFSGGALVFCLLGTSVGTLVSDPVGDPQEAVTGFFDALCAGDYEAAYPYLSGYSDLGLAGEPAGPVAQLMNKALRESYSYELYGESSVDKLTARQEVLFTYLDLPSLAPDVEAKTMEILEGYVQEKPRAELYDSENHYLPQVAQEAYSGAVTAVLEKPETYYTTTGFQLELQYVDGSWLLIPDRSLLNAINGGAA